MPLDGPEPESCPTCKGAGVILGPWEAADEALLPRAVNSVTSAQRALRRCPACGSQKSRKDALRAANLQEIHGTYEDNVSLALAALACEELLAGRRWAVLLRGGVGVGKTYMAQDYGGRWIAAGRQAYFVVAGDLLDRL